MSKGKATEPECPEETQDEELEDLPDTVKKADPYWGARIKRVIDGQTFTGQVEDIEMGSISKEKLYRIRYCDNDLEHFTMEQVKSMLDKESEAPKAKQPKQPTSAEGVMLKKPAAAQEENDEEEEEGGDEPEEQEDEEGDEAMEEDKPVLKRPADKDEPDAEKDPDQEEEEEEEAEEAEEEEAEEEDEEEEGEEQEEEAEEAEEEEDTSVLKRPAAAGKAKAAGSAKSGPKKDIEKASAKAKSKAKAKGKAVMKRPSGK